MQPILLTTVHLTTLLSIVHSRSLLSLNRRDGTFIQGYNYQGCYTEATTGRALSGTAYYNDQMTVEKCAVACKPFTYFGVEYSLECFCGNTINEGSAKTTEAECSSACPGNAAEQCGAGNRLNMYKKSTPDTISTTSSAVAISTPQSFTAKGCYTEAKNGRALTGKAYYDDAMTIEKCSTACADFTYFGLEYYRCVTIVCVD